MGKEQSLPIVVEKEVNLNEKDNKELTFNIWIKKAKAIIFRWNFQYSECNFSMIDVT